MKKKVDIIDEMPDEIQKAVMIAFNESEKGVGKSHDVVMREFLHYKKILKRRRLNSNFAQ